MALTIEDGTGVAGANSYISVVNAQTWVTARGIAVTVTEALLLKAMDYLESLRAEYQGVKTDSTQALQWPRAGVYIDGTLFDDEDIPQELISAQCQLACDAYTQSLFVNSTGKVVTGKTIGPLAWTYAASSVAAPQPVFAAANALLKPLLNSSGGLFTERV